MKSIPASVRSPILMLNVLGAAIVACCVGGVIWYTIVRADRTTTEIASYRTIIEDARFDLRRVRKTRDSTRELLEQQRTQLAESGQLPQQTAVEPYFQALSSMAVEHRLHVVSHEPLAAREYPGLLEQRFTTVVTGATPDLMRFLRAVEKTSYWADVGFLEIKSSNLQSPERRRELTASLTMSLFSAPPADANGQD